MLPRDGRLAIITGGWGPERHENLGGAESVAASLTDAGFNVTVIDVRTPSMLASLPANVDFAFLAHTEELPSIPILDHMGVPHSGPSWTTAAATYDKSITYHAAGDLGLRIPDQLSVEAALSEFALGNAVVSKPARCGSSIGVGYSADGPSLFANLEAAASAAGPSPLLIERYVGGPEYTVACLGRRIVGVLEATYAGHILDAESKNFIQCSYQLVEHDRLDHLASSISALSEALGLTCFWRADFREDEGTLVLLDVNALPYLGAPPDGMVASLLHGIGIGHVDFLERVARCPHERGRGQSRRNSSSATPQSSSSRVTSDSSRRSVSHSTRRSTS